MNEEDLAHWGLLGQKQTKTQVELSSKCCMLRTSFIYIQTDRFVFNYTRTPLLKRISPPPLAAHYPRRTSASLFVVLCPSLTYAAFLHVTILIFLMSCSASSFHPALGLILGRLWYSLACYIFSVFLASSLLTYLLHGAESFLRS